jgi:hypothetical protein
MNETDKIKEKLKQKGFLSSRKEYEFYYEIQALSFAEKIERFGGKFIRLSKKLLNSDKDPFRLISRVKGYENRILLADTYLAIEQGWTTIRKDCPHRLVNYCTKIEEKCSPFTCPDLAYFDQEQ